jgi:type I restriction enzyme S subunit
LKIKDIFKIKKGRKEGLIETKNHDSIRYVQIEDLRNNKNIKYCKINSKNVIVNEKSIIIAWDGANAGTIGSCLCGAIGSTLAKLETKSNLFAAEYITKFLSSKSRYLRDHCTGTTIPHINRSVLENIDIPVILMDCQLKIVKVLDKAQMLIDARKEQIKLLDDLIKSVFYDMFGDPVLNSKGWEQKELKEFVDFMTSGSRGWAKYYSEIGSLFIRINNVKNSRINLDSVQYVLPPDSMEAIRTKVKSNDLLVTITADLGRTAVISKEIADNSAYINQHICLLRLKKSCNPLYFSYFIESSGGIIQIKKLDQTGVKSGLNFNSIKSLQINCPPLELQNQFAEKVKKIESQKEKLQNSLVELENNSNNLIQKAFKGELFS